MTFEKKIVKLEEICDKLSDGLHKAPVFVPNGEYIFVNAQNLENSKIIDKDKTKHTTYNEFLKYGVELTERTILYSIDGTIGNIARYNGEKCLLGKGACYINLKNNVSVDYIYYQLQSPHFKNYISNMATGSTIKHISLKTMKNYSFYLPSLLKQKQISYILKSLDDKIELNNRINKNLEQQAQAIFKSWFIDFECFNNDLVMTPANFLAPKSLKMIQISNIPHILETGKRPKGGASAKGIPSIGAENVKKLGVFDTSKEKFIPMDFALKLNKGRKPGTFIPHFSMFGEGFPYEHFFINEHVFKLDFGNRGFNEFAYFYFQTDYVYNWLANNGGKAAVPGINQKDINDIWIFDPSNEKIKLFCDLVQPFFTTIFINCKQNMRFAKIRDLLLPKLMNGEIDVSEINLE